MVTRGTNREVQLKQRPLERSSDSPGEAFRAFRDSKDLAEGHRTDGSGDDLMLSQLQSEERQTLRRPPPSCRLWAFRWVGDQQAASDGEQRGSTFGRC
jgi:hypothetical protein